MKRHRPWLQDQRGSISLAGLITTLLIFTAFLTAVLMMQRAHHSIKNRNRAYLCFRYQNHSTIRYLKSMKRYNRVLKVLYPLTLAPPTAPKAKPAHQAAQVMQQLMHLSYLKKIKAYPFCQLDMTSNHIKSIPYKTIKVLALQRNQNGTVPLRFEQWKVYLHTPGKDGAESVVLGGEFSIVSGEITPKLSTWEGIKEEASNWNASSGPAF